MTAPTSQYIVQVPLLYMIWTTLLVPDVALTNIVRNANDLFLFLLLRRVHFLAIHLGVRLESVFRGSGSCGQDFDVELWSCVVANELSWFVTRGHKRLTGSDMSRELALVGNGIWVLGHFGM